MQMGLRKIGSVTCNGVINRILLIKINNPPVNHGSRPQLRSHCN